MATADVLGLSISELGALYRSRAVSPVEVTRAVLRKAEKERRRLNAFITLLPDEALRAAAEAEKAFRAGSPASPLTGVPVSLKDLFCTRGIRTTCGSRILKDFIPDHSATAVERLEAAGAVIFAKANLLEFAYGTVHPDYGQCNNPHDPRRTAGGSSGGSAASVAAGIGYASLGTDTGGSIRIPAAYCGVAGLKPTYGLVSTFGVFPLSWSLDHVGPIARTAADLAVVLDAIAGFDPRDRYSDPRAGEKWSELKSGSAALKLGLFPAADLAGLDPDVKACFDRALRTLKQLGYRFVEADLPRAREVEAALMRVLLPEAAHIHRRWLDRGDDYAPQTYQQIMEGTKMKAADYLKGVEERGQVKRGVSLALERLEAIVSPTVSFPAPAQDPVIGDEGKDEMVFTGIFNVSGHPAVTVPCGFTSDGLPVGIQFAGASFSDRRLLALAQRFQEARKPAGGVT